MQWILEPRPLHLRDGMRTRCDPSSGACRGNCKAACDCCKGGRWGCRRRRILQGPAAFVPEFQTFFFMLCHVLPVAHCRCSTFYNSGFATCTCAGLTYLSWKDKKTPLKPHRGPGIPVQGFLHLRVSWACLRTWRTSEFRAHLGSDASQTSLDPWFPRIRSDAALHSSNPETLVWLRRLS